MLNTPASFPHVGAEALISEGSARLPVRIVRREGADAFVAISGRPGAGGFRRVPVAELIDPAVAGSPAAAAAALDRFVAGKDEVRVRDIEAHLAALGGFLFRGASISRLLADRGWARRIRACGTVWVRRTAAERIVEDIAPGAEVTEKADAAASAPTVTVGRLGAEIVPPFTRARVSEARLAEIERRILALEATAGMTGGGVAPEPRP